MAFSMIITAPNISSANVLISPGLLKSLSTYSKGRGTLIIDLSLQVGVTKNVLCLSMVSLVPSAILIPATADISDVTSSSVIVTSAVDVDGLSVQTGSL